MVAEGGSRRWQQSDVLIVRKIKGCCKFLGWSRKASGHIQMLFLAGTEKFFVSHRMEIDNFKNHLGDHSFQKDLSVNTALDSCYM